jgi:gamma-glutamyltranspeptidase/glutathione hydrolase
MKATGRFRWLAVLLVMVTIVLTVAAQNRGPGFERVEISDEASEPTRQPLVWGSRYAVSSMQAQASATAERVLQAGGNAFDAVVAGQAVLSVLEPENTGVGSDATLLVYDAKQKKVWSINAEGTAPKLATIEWYEQHHKGELPRSDTLLSATVPGVVDAWYILLSRWGTKTFGEVLAPAIELSEKGYPLSSFYARAFGARRLTKYASTARVYAPNGKKWKEGEIFQNSDLANTLRRMVEAEQQAAGQGREAALRAARDCFYKGDIAREMAAFSKENGGLFRYEDFASYSAKVEEPVSMNYRGYEVYKNPSASQGPAELLILGMLEGYDLRAIGHNTADYIHLSVEAAKLAMADRDTYLGDVDFIQIPYEGLLSGQYAADRRKLIDPQKASLEFRPGEPEHYMSGYQPSSRPRDLKLAGDDGDHEGDTSYIAVIDQQRNAVSFTPSLHSGFGAKVMMGNLGFIFNCRGDYFSLVPGHANALEPGKRPRSTLQGSVVLKDGKLFMVTGSPGADDQCMRTMQTLLNVVEFGMNVQQAIEAPRWTTRSFPASAFPHMMYPGDLQVEDRILPSVRAELVRRGHRLTVRPAWSIGKSGAILIDPETGALAAGADPRRYAHHGWSAQALAW